jgi:hypothetical protein
MHPPTNKKLEIHPNLKSQSFPNAQPSITVTPPTTRDTLTSPDDLTRSPHGDAIYAILKYAPPKIKWTEPFQIKDPKT